MAKQDRPNSNIDELDLLEGIGETQVERFKKLSGEARRLAVYGIERHHRACHRIGAMPNTLAVREIIDDALNGKSLADQMDHAAPPAEVEEYHLSVTALCIEALKA